MNTMKEVTDQLAADREAFVTYVAKRDASDADLQGQLKDQAAKIVTDEAELADLHAQIDAAFTAAKALGDTINPPPVSTTPVDTGTVVEPPAGTGTVVEPPAGTAPPAA